MGNGHAIPANQNANGFHLSDGCLPRPASTWKRRLLEIGSHMIHPKKWKIARRHLAERKAREIIETALHNAAAHKKLKVKKIDPPDFLHDPKSVQRRQRKTDEKNGGNGGLAHVMLRVNVKFGEVPFNVFMKLQHNKMDKEIASEINAYLGSKHTHYEVSGICIGNDFNGKAETMSMVIDLKKRT